MTVKLSFEGKIILKRGFCLDVDKIINKWLNILKTVMIPQLSLRTTDISR